VRLRNTKKRQPVLVLFLFCPKPTVSHSLVCWGFRDWLETFCAERVTTRRIGQCDDNRHRGNITIENRVGRRSGKNSAEVKLCICYVCVAGKRPARWAAKNADSRFMHPIQHRSREKHKHTWSRCPDSSPLVDTTSRHLLGYALVRTNLPTTTTTKRAQIYLQILQNSPCKNSPYADVISLAPLHIDQHRLQLLLQPTLPCRCRQRLRLTAAAERGCARGLA
jgi:hypothetical protein